MSRFSQVEPLRIDHRVHAFDCGSEAQTTWLRRHAFQSQQASFTSVYVVRRLADDLVVGYYALRTGAVLTDQAPERLTKGAGGYPDIGVLVLSRLGVDLSEQGQGLGRAVLKDALTRSLRIADSVAFRALQIHAESETARDWYLRQAAFESSPLQPNTLFLLFKDLRRAAGAT